MFSYALVGHNPADQRRRLGQVVAIGDVYVWKLLRQDAGLSREQTELALVELLESLIKEDNEPNPGLHESSSGQLPVTPILDELHRRGHEITLRTLASQVPLMRERGFDAAAIDPAIEAIAINDYLARTPLGAEKRSVRTFCERAKIDAVDLQRAIDQLNPDALLVDFNAWGAMIVAERWGGPWASCCCIRCPYRLVMRHRSAQACAPHRGR